MIDALRAIPPSDRAAAIDSTARRFSCQAMLIDAIGIAVFVTGWLAVWFVTPSHEIGRPSPRPAARSAVPMPPMGPHSDRPPGRALQGVGSAVTLLGDAT